METFFTNIRFYILPSYSAAELDSVQPLWDATVEAKAKRCATATICAVADQDIVDKCSIPRYNQPLTYDIPPCSDVTISNMLQEYKHLFRSKPDATTLAYHHIPTTENPVRVPMHQIPGHYKQEIEHQIHEMLQQGIIEESWMAPAVCF